MTRDGRPSTPGRKAGDDYSGIQQGKAQVRARYDGLAHGYIRHYSHPKSLFGLEKQRRAKILVDYLVDIQPSSAVLDLGCGPGYVASKAAEHLPEVEVVGVDFSDSMVQFARANYGDRVFFVKGDIEHLPFSAGRFDFVYALGVLDKFRCPDRLFCEVYRVLCPGGMFFFTYLNRNSGSMRMLRVGRYLRQRRQNAGSRHLLGFNSLAALVQGTGFKVERRYYITYGGGAFNWPWAKLMNIGLERLLGHRELGRVLAMSAIWLTQKDSRSTR
jgi:ubiquinone/menaquinone biosynthesis C-methylase UbiE